MELSYDRMVVNDVRRKEDGENTHWGFAAVPKVKRAGAGFPQSWASIYDV